MTSSVPGGSKFGGGRWRPVRRWADLIGQLTVDVFGGVEGMTTYYPRVEELIS